MKLRLHDAVRTTKPFPADLGTLACACVINAAKPVLFVSHAGGDWQMYCHWQNHDFSHPDIASTIRVVHISHLLAIDPTLASIADLPVDMGAERSRVGDTWHRFADADD